jgi:hypothetical protein
MTIEVLHERGCGNREIARQLGIDEKAVRYRLARRASGARDGRADTTRPPLPLRTSWPGWSGPSAFARTTIGRTPPARRDDPTERDREPQNLMAYR